MCIPRSEVRNSGMPRTLGRIVNLRSCNQTTLQEKDNVEIKVKQNRDKSNANKENLNNHLSYSLSTRKQGARLLPATCSLLYFF